MVRGNQREERVAVAIDKDKGSHQALKWTVDRLLSRGQALTLLHVKQKPFSSPNSLTKVSSVSEMSGDEASSMAHKQHLDSQATKDFFLPFRCLCTRKDIQCNEVVLEDPEIAKTLINYCNQNWIDILVLGAPSKGGIVKRFKFSDVPSSVSKGAPEFCTVYVIAKGKVSSVKQSSSPTPPKSTTVSSPRHQNHSNSSTPGSPRHQNHSNSSTLGSPRHQHHSNSSALSSPRHQLQSNSGTLSSPFNHHHSNPSTIHSTHNQNQHQHHSNPNTLPSPRNRLQLQHQSTFGSLPSPNSNNQKYHHHEGTTDAHHIRPLPSKNHLESIIPPRRSLQPQEDIDIKSPFTRPGIKALRKGHEHFTPDTDISFVSRGRPSLERSFASPWSSNGDSLRPSNFSDMDNLNYLPPIFGMKSIDSASLNGFSSSSQETDSLSWSSNSLNMDDVETEMRRLKLELKQTMGMYNSTACKEAFTAKQKANELHHWKQVEEQRFEEARSAGEATMEMAEKEKEKSNVEIEAAETAQKTADLEVRKRASLEKMAEEDTDEATKAMADFGPKDVEYRRYTFKDIQKATENFSNSLKIGEGGYGPVYRGELDNTSVAIKVLGPDATQGRSQFQQEVEVLSCIRHPNMVLLLGACPENGCLVYEYMANGSLEDCLFRKGGAPVLPWQLRFRIAAEIATGLLFLHQARPEPIVHRDLKPANILLDHNYVSKISDVGLARLIPPSVADSMTQYRMTATAGTFCYIDPEYQQTGMLGIKSDIYSLGVILLQILTSRSPMGLTHTVERSIEKGNFADILDPYVHDWPVEEAQKLAELSLQCLEMRKRDRPDLKKVVLPELDRLRALAEESMGFSTSMSIISASSSPYPSHDSSFQEITSPHHQVYSSSLWSGSTMSQSSSTSSYSGRRSYWME